jgi:ADP-heptose:LPS heptosyltransferase
MHTPSRSDSAPAANPADRAAPRKQLIVRIRNWVGDVVLGLPGLRLIESQGYSLHIVARGKWAPALLAGYGWPVHVQPPKRADKIKQLRALREQCRQLDPGFDRRENALVMPESFSSALEMRLAGLRGVGYAKEGRSLLLARSERITLGGHALISYWNLACRFLRVELPPPAHVGLLTEAGAVQEAQRLLTAAGITGDYAMICPFAAGLATSRKLAKKWPEFGRFVEQAPAQLGLPLVVYPGPGEHDQARELYPSARMIEGANLSVYAALLQRARIVVSNDTGPAHMAAALGTRLISVLGPTIAREWAPWGPRVTVVQEPQPAEGTVWPTVEKVLDAARRSLADGDAG